MVLDRVLRVVNGDIITSAELQGKVQETIILARRSGATCRPTVSNWLNCAMNCSSSSPRRCCSTRKWLAWVLTIDERPIQRQVTMEVKRLGRHTTLAEQSEEVDRRVREQQRRSLVRFLNNTPKIFHHQTCSAPSGSSRRNFMRPQRREWYRITRRAATDADHKAFGEALADVFRRSSVANDEPSRH